MFTKTINGALYISAISLALAFLSPRKLNPGYGVVVVVAIVVVVVVVVV